MQYSTRKQRERERRIRSSAAVAVVRRYIQCRRCSEDTSNPRITIMPSRNSTLSYFSRKTWKNKKNKIIVFSNAEKNIAFNCTSDMNLREQVAKFSISLLIFGRSALNGLHLLTANAKYDKFDCVNYARSRSRMVFFLASGTRGKNESQINS